MTQESMSTVSSERIREALRAVSEQQGEPRESIARIIRLASILRFHPHLGPPWARKFLDLIADMEYALADLED